MKFKSEQDKQLFLLEVLGNNIPQDLPEDELEPLIHSFIKRRRPVVKLLKDKKRSIIQKQNWRKYRAKYLRAIRAFHRSIKGKRFHRNLGNFLALRLTRDTPLRLSKEEKFEFLKLLSSFKTHWYIEGCYYKPLLEEVEYELFTEEVIPLIDEIERKVMLTDTLDKEDIQFLFDIISDERFYSIKEAINRFKEGYNNPSSKTLISCYAQCGKFVRENNRHDLILALVSCLPDKESGVNHALLLDENKDIVFDPNEPNRVFYNYPNIGYKLGRVGKHTFDCLIVYGESVKNILQ